MTVLSLTTLRIIKDQCAQQSLLELETADQKYRLIDPKRVCCLFYMQACMHDGLKCSTAIPRKINRFLFLGVRSFFLDLGGPNLLLQVRSILDVVIKIQYYPSKHSATSSPSYCSIDYILLSRKVCNVDQSHRLPCAHLGRQQRVCPR